MSKLSTYQGRSIEKVGRQAKEKNIPKAGVMKTSKGRIEMLDGLRGLALLAVVGYHAAPSTVRGGFLGVEVFFVLSGYLLASLLLDEVHHNGSVDMPAYFGRRVRRIGPGLVVLLFALLIAIPLIAAPDSHRLRGDILSSLAGVTNWHLIKDHASYFTQTGRPPLVRHLWSVSIEMQFYLLCPFLVVWLAKRNARVTKAALIAGMAASAGAMALLYRSADPSRAYYGADTRMSALLAGVLLAFWIANRKRSTPACSGSSIWALPAGFLGLALLGILTFTADESSRWLYPLGFLATQAAAVSLIAGGLKDRRLAGMLETPPLVWLGKRSYGIYLWHWPAVALLRPGIDVGWPTPVAIAAGLGAAVVLGALSYRFIEKPLMSKRTPGGEPRRLRSRVLGPAVALLTLVPLIALAINTTTADPIRAGLLEGQRVLARQHLPPSIPPPLVLTAVAPLVVAPAAPAPAPPPPPPPPAAPAPKPDLHAPPPGTVRVTAIGDSVMLIAAGALQARLGSSAYIDAKLGRQFNDELQAVRTLRDSGRLADVVVLHFGNNGPVTASQVDSLLGELAAVPHVVLVTVRVDKPWQNLANESFRSAAGRNPKVHIADWYVHSSGHPEWFQSDGTHMKTSGGSGAQAYADLIAGSIPNEPGSPAPGAAGGSNPPPTPAGQPSPENPPPGEPAQPQSEIIPGIL